MKTERVMICSPARAHSHYEYEWMDCVSSICYTEEEYHTLWFACLPLFVGIRMEIEFGGSYYKYTGCDMEATFRVQEMFKVLAQRTPEPMGIPED